MAKHYNFRCKFCDTGFVREDRYIAHRCKQMKRDEEIRTPDGMAALEYYKIWMRALRRSIPNAEQFLNSSKYTTFIKFARWSKSVGLPNTEQYIKYMVRLDAQPVIWTTDEMYGEYLRYLDRGSDPWVQVDSTIKFMEKMSDSLECDLSGLFEIAPDDYNPQTSERLYLTPNDVIMFLRQRKLSPWILLYSKNFQIFFNTAPMEQKQQMAAIIKPDNWPQYRRDNPEAAEKIKELVRELKL